MQNIQHLQNMHDRRNIQGIFGTCPPESSSQQTNARSSHWPCIPAISCMADGEVRFVGQESSKLPAHPADPDLMSPAGLAHHQDTPLAHHHWTDQTS